MATPGAATRQKTTAETLRDYQKYIEQLENLVIGLQETFDNQSAEPESSLLGLITLGIHLLLTMKAIPKTFLMRK